MSKIEELTEKVQKLMEEIETFKQKEKAEEFEYPFEDKEEYWSVGVNGGINHLPWTGIEFDTKRYEQGHVFKTEQEAIRERDKRTLMTRFRQFRDKCNGDWKPNWINNQEQKYFMRYFSGCKSCDVTYCVQGDLFSSFGYFKSPDDCKRAVELFGDEIKRLYVEE